MIYYILYIYIYMYILLFFPPKVFYLCLLTTNIVYLINEFSLLFQVSIAERSKCKVISSFFDQFFYHV